MLPESIRSLCRGLTAGSRCSAAVLSASCYVPRDRSLPFASDWQWVHRPLRVLPCGSRPPAPVFNRCDGTPGPILAVIKNTQCRAPAATLGAGDPRFVSACCLCQASLRGLGPNTPSCAPAPPFFFLGSHFKDRGGLWQLDKGGRGLTGWKSVLYKYFHLVFLSACWRRCRAETHLALWQLGFLSRAWHLSSLQSEIWIIRRWCVESYGEEMFQRTHL